MLGTMTSILETRVGKNESIYSYLAENHPELVEDEYFSPHTTAVISIPRRLRSSILRTESGLQLLKRVKNVTDEWVRPVFARVRTPTTSRLPFLSRMLNGSMLVVDVGKSQ